MFAYSLDLLRLAWGRVQTQDSLSTSTRANTASSARVLNLAGLQLPLLETVVISVATFVLLIDYYHGFAQLGNSYLSQALDRAVLFGAIPLLVLLLLRQSPRQYGLHLGDWRLGLALMSLAGLIMTPIILFVAGLPDFASYYQREQTSLAQLALANVLDVGTAEFLFRGFLMMALLRRCGPIAIVIATFPFVFTHLGKPELETLSCLFGGTAFGWLAWRTNSVLYGAALHVFILTLIFWVAAA